MDSQKEKVFYADASDLGFGVRKWPLTVEQEQLTFAIIGFMRNAEGEILFAMYGTNDGKLLRVFND